MGKIVSLEERKKAKKSTPPIDRDTYHLWQLSHDLDRIITEGIVDKGLKIEEVSAVLAHRLGSLMKRAENPEKILAFCESLARRLVEGENPPKETG